jgi:hypothetical protein
MWYSIYKRVALIFLKETHKVHRALPDHHRLGVEMIARFEGTQASRRMDSRNRKEVCKLSGHSPVVLQAARKHEKAESPEAEG